MEEIEYHTGDVASRRILYTPSTFAKCNLIHLQEAGTLTALRPHVSRREKLGSYLFMLVLRGSGTVRYEGKTYSLTQGDCAFLDCRKAYEHSCSAQDLWSLQWVHFYGANLDDIYAKFLSRGGVPCFPLKDAAWYQGLLTEIFDAAHTDDHVRDMRIFTKLATLLTALFAEDVGAEKSSAATRRLLPVKEYLDVHFAGQIRLDALAERFFLNKFYLTKLFKKQFGVTINGYVIHRRIAKAKELLRFTDRPVEEIAQACGMEDAAYFARVFKQAEGVSPRHYRKTWAKS
ncbi:MAG: AraC family transcriptional regulator [Oscillospiraceae bacterium]